MIRKILYILVLVVGSLQIVGWITHVQPIRGVGMAYCSSPLPIVFTEVRGVETFASNFFIHYQVDDMRYKKHITPEMYSQLEGPYNRRNVYGAAISYGPVLPEELWQSVLNYGVCEGSLLQELGLPENTKNVSIEIVTRTAGKLDKWTLQTQCP